MQIYNTEELKGIQDDGGIERRGREGSGGGNQIRQVTFRNQS